MILGIAALDLLSTFASTSQVCKSFLHPNYPSGTVSNPDRDLGKWEGGSRGVRVINEAGTTGDAFIFGSCSCVIEFI